MGSIKHTIEGMPLYHRVLCKAWNIRAKALWKAIDRGWLTEKEVMPTIIEIKYTEI